MNTLDTEKKLYWEDIPELQMSKNDVGEIVDVLNNQLAFSGNVDLLPAGSKLNYTIEMIQEIVKCRDDIIYFAENYYKSQTPDGFNYIKLFDYQKTVLRDMVDNQRYVLMMPRQMGKTLIARIFILWSVLFGKDINYGIAANKQAQAVEILDGIKMAYMSLPLWMQQGVKRWNGMSIALENGGKIKIAATSSSAFRGMSFAASYEFTTQEGVSKRISSGIYVDEIAFVPANKFEEFKNSVIPTVSSGLYGRIIYTSTPFGMNHFYKIWKEAENNLNGFGHRFIPYWEHPLRDEKWAEDKKKELGSDVAFQQEYGCSFSGSSFTLIEGKHLSKLTYQPTWDTRHNLPDVKIYEHPKEDHYYMLGVDTAKYGDGDFLSMQVIDVTSKPFKQVATFRRKDITYLNLVEPLYNLGTYYNNAYMFIENNSGDGQSTADLVSNNYDYENIYAEKSDIFGFRTTPKSRKIGLQNLKQLIEDDMLILNDEETYNELLRFSLKNGKYQAVDGYNDDSVMALVASLFFLQVKAWVDIEDLHKFFKGDSEDSSDDDCFVFGFIDDGSGNMIPF